MNVLNFTQVTKNLVTNLELSYLARMLQLVAVAMISSAPSHCFEKFGSYLKMKNICWKIEGSFHRMGGWGRVEKKRGREREPEAK